MKNEEKINVIQKNDYDEIWIQAKNEIEKRLSSKKYRTWFKDLEFVKYDNSVITLMTENGFNKLILGTRYTEFIEKSFEYVTGEKFKVDFVAKEDPNEMKIIWED